MLLRSCVPAACAAGVVALCAPGAASGAVLATGSYYLANHPDGNARPPLYGLRLDELYNATSGHDIFTFDFEHPSSVMIMDFTATTIRIHGVTWGGRDTGTGYAADAYQGLYTVDMLYNVGVMGVPGDDDVWVNGPNHANTGFILTPLGDTIPLWDERGGFGYSLRIGDENDDAGHRGFEGVSGWGWLNHGSPDHHVAASDFLFTVGAPVPAPGAAGLLAAGALILTGRRRR